MEEFARRQGNLVNNSRTDSDDDDGSTNGVDAISGIDLESIMGKNSRSTKSYDSFDDNDYSTRALLCLLTAYDSPSVQTSHYEIYEKRKAVSVCRVHFLKYNQ